MSDEQRVRTMCGWIGVEISKSRVRTPGRAGYGLWRVRSMPRSTDLAEDLDEMWTAYAVTLDGIYLAAVNSVQGGMPAGPAAFQAERAGWVPGDGLPYVTVPTRWTGAYVGRRDLGVGEPVAVKREYADELTSLAALVDAGLVVMEHAPGCSCSGTEVLTAECVRRTTGRETVGRRRLADNAAFQEQHRGRRDAGLRSRHATKLGRNTSG